MRHPALARRYVRRPRAIHGGVARGAVPALLPLHPAQGAEAGGVPRAEAWAFPEGAYDLRLQVPSHSLHGALRPRAGDDELDHVGVLCALQLPPDLGRVVRAKAPGAQ